MNGRLLVALGVSALLLCCPLGAQKQQCGVRGVIRDGESSEPEAGSVVQFLSAEGDRAVAYAVSDSTGRFERALPAPGDYVLLYENLGRESIRLPFAVDGTSVTDLGEILTREDAEQLKGAQTTAMRPLVRMDVDKMAYRVEDDADSKTSTVLDMLRKVPMVTVDGQDNITVNGSSSFKVYVDGKPNQMLSANPSQIFKVMPASSVKEIEVITNPGAKYDAEGTGGVLNLVTAAGAGEKLVKDGVYGTVGAGGSYNGRFSEDYTLYLNVQKGRWTFGADLYGGYHKNPTYKVDEDSGLEQSGAYTQQLRHFEGKGDTPMVFGNMSASFELDTLNLFTANVGLSSYHSRADYDELTRVLAGSTAADVSPLYSYGSMSRGKNDYTGLDGSIDWQHTSRTTRERFFTLSYRYSGNPVNEYTARSFNALSGVVPISLDGRISDGSTMASEHTLQGDFTTPVGKGKTLSSGVKYIFRHHGSDSEYRTEGAALPTEITDYAWYNHIAAIYGEFAGTWGKIVTKAGLRYEYTWQSVDYNAGSGADFDKRYGNLVPSLSLQYNIGPMNNLGLSYNMRIRRPGIAYLNPYVNMADPSAIAYGNTGLEAEKKHTVNLVYNTFSPKLMVNATLRHSFGNDGITSYSFYDDGGIYNTTYGNIIKSRETGLNIFVNWTAGKATRVFANTSLSYCDMRSRQISAANYGWQGSVNGGVQQTLPKDFMLSSYLMVSSSSVSLQGDGSGFSGVVLGLSKKMLEDRLSLSLSCFSNLTGGSMRFDTHTSGPGFYHNQTIRVPVRSISFHVGYTFGKKAIEVKKTRRSISNDDEVGASSRQSTTGAPASASQMGM